MIAGIAEGVKKRRGGGPLLRRLSKNFIVNKWTEILGKLRAIHFFSRVAIQRFVGPLHMTVDRTPLATLARNTNAFILFALVDARQLPPNESEK